MGSVLLEMTEAGIHVTFGRIDKMATPGHRIACVMVKGKRIVAEGSGCTMEDAFYEAIKRTDPRRGRAAH